MSEARLNLTITPFGADQPVTFKTFDDAITWLHGQRDKWSGFHRDADIYPPIRNHRDAISSAISSLSKAKAGESRENAAATLHGLEMPPFLDTDGIAAESINETVGAGQTDTAYIIYLLWTDKGAPNALRHQNLDIVRLLKAAALWRDKGGSYGLEAMGYKKAMNTRLGKWEEEFKGLSERGKDWLDKTGEASTATLARQAEIEESLRTLHAGSKEQLDSLNSDHQEKLTNLHAAHEEKLAALHQTQSDALAKLHETYLEHLRLKAPADYWTDKARKHSASAQLWLKWLMGFIGVGLIGLAAFLYWNFYSLIDHVSTKSANTTAIVLLALPALLYLTLVRVAHKSYRDEVRHAVDAEQRSTLVQTYLALNNENDGKIEPGERLLALHALFRGSAHGDSPDDTPPVNSLEAIIQSLKPKT